jgi:hypothetical protein
VPEFDPASENPLQFFGIDTQVVQFDLNYLHNLTGDQIEKWIADIDQELGQPSQASSGGMKVVVPFDEQIQLSVAIGADVRAFDWDLLGRSAQFDVVLMDPPWMIQGNHPTRGLELSYELMDNDEIASMPVHKVQSR